MYTKKPKESSEALGKLYFFEEAISKIIAVLCTFWLFQLKINLIFHVIISYIFAALFLAPINQ